MKKIIITDNKLAELRERNKARSEEAKARLGTKLCTHASHAAHLVRATSILGNNSKGLLS